MIAERPTPQPPNYAPGLLRAVHPVHRGIRVGVGDRDRDLLLLAVDRRRAGERVVLLDLLPARAVHVLHVLDLVLLAQDLHHALLDRGRVEGLGDEEARHPESQDAHRAQRDHHDRDRHPQPGLGLLLLGLLVAAAGVLATVDLPELLPLLLVRLLLVSRRLLLRQRPARRVLLRLRAARRVLLSPPATLLSGVTTLRVTPRLLTPLLWAVASIGRAHRASSRTAFCAGSNHMTSPSDEPAVFTLSDP